MAIRQKIYVEHESLVKIHFDWTKDVLNIWYKRGVLTPSFQEEYDRVREDEGMTPHQALAWNIAQVVTRWDYLGEDDEPLPVDEKFLGSPDFPYPLLLAINGAIQEDLAANPTKRNSSERGF